MAVAEEHTGFEWLDTPFIITRFIVTLFGVLFIAAAVLALWTLLSMEWGTFARVRAPVASTGPVEDEIVRPSICPGFEPTPGRDLLLAGVLGFLPVLGMLRVWTRPRMGFLLSGSGYALLLTVGIVMMLSDEGMGKSWRLLDWKRVAISLLPLPWLGFAWLKVGPDSQRNS